MNKFRPEMSPSEQRDFLTHTKLYLSKDVKRVLWGTDIYMIKHLPTGVKMCVDADELFVLGQFGRGLSMAELVPQLIMNRRCLPLPRLYELILQARAANILNEQRDEEFAIDYPVQWWPSLGSDVAQILWLVVSFVSALILLYWGFVADGTCVLMLPGWSEAVLAWGVISGCASLGGLMASAYVRRAGGDVHRPKLIWRSLVPRIGFDWSDADMIGPRAHKIVAQLRIIPFLVVASVCTLVPDLREWAPVAMLALLWRMAPLPFTAASQWLEAGNRRKLLSTSRPKYFYHHGQSWVEKFWREFTHTDWAFAAKVASWSVVWMASAFWFLGAFMVGRATVVFPLLFDVNKIEHEFLIVGPPLVGALGLCIVMVVLGWWRARSRLIGYGRGPVEESTGSLDILQIIEDSPLFREIPAEVRVQLVKMAKPVTVPAGSPVVGPGDTGADLYIVADGKLRIELPRTKGKPDSVAVLRRGDVFGSFAFCGSLMRSEHMRAQNSVSLLAISSPELESILKRHVSIPVIEEIVQRRAFLRRIPLSAGWSPESVVSFAKAARMESMNEGQVVIGAGRENRFFYLVYDGSMLAKRRGRRVGRVAPGDFFGELSLLLNNLANADMVAEVPTKCLVLQKSDFLALMGKDIELAMQVEYVASGRMGAPLFPFRGSSIEALAH